MHAIKRIAIFGAESTGKSTLAMQLGAHFGAPVVPEFVRGFWDAREGKIVASDLEEIARGQMESEDEAVRSRSMPAALQQDQSSTDHSVPNLLICDTELLTNVLWADLLFPGQCPTWVRTVAETRCRHYTLYLLCDTDIPFTPDPQRCFPLEKDRQMCRELWRATLVSRDLPKIEISGDWGVRKTQAIKAVESFI